MVFGPEKPFLRYLGGYVAIMTIPNFLGLDHWQTFLMGEGDAGAGVIGLDGSGTARAYLGFESKEPVEYDYRDEDAQKQLLAERSVPIGDNGVHAGTLPAPTGCGHCVVRAGQPGKEARSPLAAAPGPDE